MFTIRRIQRLWTGKAFRSLAHELLAGRVESSTRLATELAHAVPVAALAIVRLDELGQSHHPFYRTLLNVLILAQEADGGWGDVLTSALCVRALTCGGGEGSAVERGIAYLARLQKVEGAWPRVPIRRMPADGFVSAFVLFALAEVESFRQAVRMGDAYAWIDAAVPAFDDETRRLWDHASARSRIRRARPADLTHLWS